MKEIKLPKEKQSNLLKLQSSLRDKCTECGTKNNVYYSNMLSTMVCERCENILMPF